MSNEIVVLYDLFIPVALLKAAVLSDTAHLVFLEYIFSLQD